MAETTAFTGWGYTFLLSICIWVLLFSWRRAGPTYALMGDPTVVDGDTVRIRRTTVRIADIDAPELSQTYRGLLGKRPVGRRSKAVLKRKIAGRICYVPVAKSGKYGRRVGDLMLRRQLLPDVNLGRWMVRRGWAYAKSYEGPKKRYAADEWMARLLWREMWFGIAWRKRPWRYRRERQA